MISMPAMYILFTNNEFNPGTKKKVLKLMVFCHFVQFCISYFSKDAATIVNHKVHAKGWHTINLKIKSNFLIWSIGFVCKPQSKYPVLHEGVFVGTGFLFLGRLGSRASTEKKVGGQLWAILEGVFFMFWGAKKDSKFFWKPHSVRTKKLHNTEKANFLGMRKFSNLNVLHKGFLMQDWVFRLGCKLL